MRLRTSFGLRFRLPDDLIAVYKGFGNDFTVGNGEPSWTLPMPARYVIDRNGVIAYAEVNADYTRRPDPTELFPILRRLRQGARRPEWLVAGLSDPHGAVSRPREPCRAGRERDER